MLTFTLAHEQARANAIKAVTNAPAGYRVIVKEPKRTTAQNDLMWDLLTDISEQGQWYGQSLITDDWKLIFLQSLNSELRIVPNMAGNGFVNLSRSSKLSVGEMSNLIELIYMYGWQHGVKFHNEKERKAA